MRTTLDIDDDLLGAAREMARRERSSAGQVISRLLRVALAGAQAPSPGGVEGGPVINGFRPFAPRDRLVSDDTVEHLRDVEGV